MTEVRLQLKKAIPIIAVTWILSMITTLVIVCFAPNIFKTWHEVERLEGYDTDDVVFIDVPSMQWRIHLGVISSDPQNKDVRFHLTVDDFALRELTWEYIFAGYMRENHFTGSGRHRIEIVADGVEWVVVIEAYY